MWLFSVNNVSIQMTKKIQKSLIIIVFITIGGYLIGAAYLFVAMIFGSISIGNTPLGKYAMSKYLVDFTDVSLAASYYIYFYNSTEYRIAFVAILRNYLGCRFLSRFISKQSITPIVAFIGKNQLHPIPVNHQWVKIIRLINDTIISDHDSTIKDINNIGE